MRLVTFLLPVLMAIGTSMAIDRGMERRGLLPPNFRIGPAATAPLRQRALVRRAAALMVMAIVLAIGIFGPLTMLGSAEPAALDGLTTPDLFTLHTVFLTGLAAWYLLGFSGTGAAVTAWRRQLGFSAGSIVREIGIGVAAGVAGWLVVIALLLLVAAVVYMVAGQDALPSEPPEIIGWIVALPVAVRLALSLSAGVVEETFFRGFLQPRIGIVASSILFVMAHLSYDQPFLLVGVGVLSILFALLVRWRQSIWAAIVAHTVFDAVQLLFVIPSALDMLERAEEPAAVSSFLRLAVGSI
jgi:membrane protease YdiL (CAAX protease family)